MNPRPAFLADHPSPMYSHPMVTIPSENSGTETEEQARRAPGPVDWSSVQKVHVMGICGSAMGAFAGMLRMRGFEVRGSDKGAYPPMSTTLASQGVHIYEGYEASNLAWAPDVVVVGNVVRPFFPEAAAVRQRGIPYCSLPQALAALFIDSRHSVVVTGTHGKTTTSSMTAWLLHESGLDPGFMIGGITGNFAANHRVSDGPTFVVEGDEYDTAYFDKGPKFLHYRPQSAAITNIEFDHADIYADLQAIETSFRRFVDIVPEDGRLIIPANDATVERVAAGSAARVWTFGLEVEADISATGIASDDNGTAFTLNLPETPPLSARLALWGDHNLRNALTAAGLAFTAGADPEDIVRALATFSLPMKRQQLRGEVSDIPVIDDFAHHPTAIRATIQATKQRYPGRRVLALFEVESNTSRRRVFQDDFGEALGGADHVWFCQPHEKDDNLPLEQRLDLGELIGHIRDAGTPAELISEIQVLAEHVAVAAQPGRDVILVMSGRNFHGIHDQILERLASHHP
ncbi:MAG: UDP-N-acetylmuramate:L-alanyl-gamma-D-glutamyl-meso-diaminopimelate ligase [Myxococcota bacterium]|nr:UDP-N-acetylmuramate:L-alanyl-gamma-D-glutamyl-meso-diaminopimelate ligase [Myxococcota bacterium]MEE2778966.1 UDP-N-acetylmuramate:L-alanyl-gamma-D-glutamyl-meso-diaminopimelate ligase [Myxococcota bacterium]